MPYEYSYSDRNTGYSGNIDWRPVNILTGRIEERCPRSPSFVPGIVRLEKCPSFRERYGARRSSHRHGSTANIGNRFGRLTQKEDREPVTPRHESPHHRSSSRKRPSSKELTREPCSLHRLNARRRERPIYQDIDTLAASAYHDRYDPLSYSDDRPVFREVDWDRRRSFPREDHEYSPRCRESDFGLQDLSLLDDSFDPSAPKRYCR